MAGRVSRWQSCTIALLLVLVVAVRQSQQLKCSGDAYGKDTFSVPMSHCGACDASAICGCNLLSGKYRCVCPKGYFGTAEKSSSRTCHQILCPKVPRTHHFLEAKFPATDCFARNLKVGERCEFACTNQYRLKSTSVVQCNEQSKTNPVGKWNINITALPPSCEDNEIPEVVSCPENIVVAKSGSQPVYWPEPVFRDNCGPPTQCLLYVRSTITSGSLFQEGISTPVTYTCEDPSGNRQESCSFTVLVQRPTCPHLQPPRNGAIATFGSIAQAQCQQPWFPVSNLPYIYLCQNGRWTASGAGAPASFFPIPDCTLRTPPTGLMFGFQGSFWYTGNCNKTATQAMIRNKFAQFGLCQAPKCTVEKVEVHCG